MVSISRIDFKILVADIFLFIPRHDEQKRCFEYRNGPKNVVNELFNFKSNCTSSLQETRRKEITRQCLIPISKEKEINRYQLIRINLAMLAFRF